MSKHIHDTLEHKRRVGYYMNQAISDLVERAIVHDFSKFSDEERPYFERVIDKLEHTTYGSSEYRELLREIRPALQHHYANNRHHSEYFPNGINGMNLIDLLEMVCDWMAAVERHADGDIYRSLEINKERFKVDDQLYGILVNTVKYIKEKE